MKCTVVLSGIALLISSTAFAQQPATTTPPPVTGQTIEQRKDNQQKRIGEGLEKGSMTAGEAAKVEKQEKGLNKEERDMREDNGGKLTAADKAKLTNQQNKLSNEIYKDKHNSVNQPPVTNQVNARDRNQQKRIGEGLENGSLTAGEAANLEHKEAKINKEERTDRTANGGTLTPAEKAKINRQQNKVSKQIYNKKHNGRKQN
jgi:hypothetical protein